MATEAPAETTTSTNPELDGALAELQANKEVWARLPVRDKIDLLDDLVERADRVAARWVEVAAEGKQLSPASPWVAEEWMTGPWAFIEGCRALQETLSSVAEGRLPALPKVRVLPDGRAAAKVFPADGWDTLLLNGYSAEVWMQQGVTPENLGEHMASFYFEREPQGAVALVLGAGNITSIAPLDTLHRLFNMGHVVIVKMNPVNEWLGPILEELFAPLIERGVVRFAYGGADVGRYLTRHEQVEEMHLTGSERTHDAIVFGPGDEGRKRKERNEPVVDKPFTAELGGVGTTLVLPGGKWTDADLRYHAENIVTQKLHNSGHNCVAAQVVVLPEEWEHADQLETEIRSVMEELPSRAAWYPGAAASQSAAVARHKAHHVCGGDVPPTLLVDVRPDGDHFAFREEFFSPVLAVTRLPGSTPETFWKNAVEFANERVVGTLGINIIVHPAARRTMGDTFDQGLRELRFGAIGVNVWNAVAYLLPRCTWGAYPGHPRTDIQSGTGVVHNAYMFDRPEKSVVFGPFAPMPRAWAKGELHMSPKPPWFVTNKTAHLTAERITRFAVNREARHVPGIFAAALRG